MLATISIFFQININYKNELFFLRCKNGFQTPKKKHTIMRPKQSLLNQKEINSLVNESTLDNLMTKSVICIR